MRSSFHSIYQVLSWWLHGLSVLALKSWDRNWISLTINWLSHSSQLLPTFFQIPFNYAQLASFFSIWFSAGELQLSFNYSLSEEMKKKKGTPQQWFYRQRYKWGSTVVGSKIKHAIAIMVGVSEWETRLKRVLHSNKMHVVREGGGQGKEWGSRGRYGTTNLFVVAVKHIERELVCTRCRVWNREWCWSVFV